MDDELDELEPYFDDLGFEPEEEEEKMRELYARFCDDFIENPIDVNGVVVVIKQALSKHVGQPEYFKEFKHDFVHTITRQGNISKRRVFEPQRANRVHWIKPVLTNSNDARIRTFQFTEGNGKLRDYFWFEEKDFVVVLEKVLPDYWLITAHIVDDKLKLQKRLWAYKEANQRK
ncbi:MAG: hypothetical protein JEZ09_16850 [Salinivirgaceae bacterium]|nr:hypothetical protein [Salinivirgaceae bacterium]